MNQNTIAQQNASCFDKEEENRYIYRKDQQLRANMIVSITKQIIGKLSQASQKKVNILSIACSTGVIEEKIKKETGAEVYGIDIAPQALQEARSRGIITKLADVSKKLPYKKASFDIIIACEIIEHLLDTKQFLSEIHRLLKPGGYLILSTPNLARFDDRIKFLFGFAPRHTTPIHPYLYLHIRPFTYKSLKSSLKVCGFKEITLKSHLFIAEFFSRKISFESTESTFLARLFPSLSATLIVTAQK